MRKIIVIFLSLVGIKADAQKRATWQASFEINGQSSSSPKIITTSPYYKLVDSASNLFKKFNYESAEETQTKIKTGVSGGIYYNYPVSKNIEINAGLLVSSYSIERAKKYTGGITDSSLITLQRTSYGWTDPATGGRYFQAGAGGYIFISGNPGYSTLGGFAFNYYNNQRVNPSEKINFIAIEIPVGVTCKISASKFSLNAEASPCFVISSSVSGTRKSDPEISYVGGVDNNVNAILWRLGAGVSYQMNNKIALGLNYKYFIKEILEQTDPIKFNTLGLKLRFTLPGKK